MDLLLWRHAEAEDGSPDDARRLTARGEKQALRMAQWLSEHAPAELRILVSPATRTQQTVAAFSDAFETSIDISTNTTAERLIRATGWPDAPKAVLVVGHQPTLGEVAARLLHSEQSGLSVKKGALWWIQQRERDGEMQTLLRAVISPDML